MKNPTLNFKFNNFRERNIVFVLQVHCQEDHICLQKTMIFACNIKYFNVGFREIGQTSYEIILSSRLLSEYIQIGTQGKLSLSLHRAFGRFI